MATLATSQSWALTFGLIAAIALWGMLAMAVFVILILRLMSDMQSVFPRQGDEDPEAPIYFR